MFSLNNQHQPTKICCLRSMCRLYLPSIDKPDYVISGHMMNSEKPRLLKYLHFTD